VDAEPTTPARGGAAVFEGVLPLMVHGSRFMVKGSKFLII
jgi:hypothetical protein